MDTALNPYLAFDGTTREAMEFYREVFDGKLEIQTFEESGQDSHGADPQRVMHAQLEAEAITIMASDSMPEQPVVMGNNVRLSLVGHDEAGLTDIFNKLAKDGEISVPLEKQFWGDTFGMVTDRFGLQWMVNVSAH